MDTSEHRQNAPTRERDPITKRILQLANRKGLPQRHVAQLAGIDEGSWQNRVHRGTWTWHELCDIATALDERVTVLLDATDVP